MSNGTRVVLATRNPHKLLEVRRILADTTAADVSLVSIADFPRANEVAETGRTFAENALLKASAAAAATGLPVVADDSGLTVDVLNGMPGVFSARWSGRHGDDRANLMLLLDQISDVPDDQRGAAFVCAAALVTPAGYQVVEEGRVAGRLAREPRGRNGFGYDPIFVPDGETRTTAEMSPAEKDVLSHRGRAFRAIAQQLTRLSDRPDRATSPPHHDDVVQQELSLLTRAVRSDTHRLRELLHPDFLEFGASGRVRNLASVLEAFAVDPSPPSGEATEITSVRVAENAVLLTYLLTSPGGASLRSSLWVRNRDSWRLRFHHGTPQPHTPESER
ncbi:MAG: RdgB/HAM1 family non-canonical purine NTP pyrophosphatase [Jiangellaceae bacterium]|nr:RdgB/HAM1 family non-canonical purine NTP pyrophosphatase [Jiangellaceae bacterium]